MSDASLRTPLKDVRGLGSAHSGVHHFVVQRLTAVALVGLTIWFVWFVLQLFQLDYAAAHATVARPLNAILLIALLIAMFWHAQLGVQTVIEDYVTTRWLAFTAQTVNTFLCFLGALTGVVAVARIALGS